jgi:hypothetical protein
MRTFTLTLFLLLAAGCSTGIVVHDEDRAAELIVDFLTGIKSDEGMKLSYAWTDDKFKQEISEGEFSRIVYRLRSINQGAEIQLTGYEVFGPVGLINVYASSKQSDGMMYFRFVLTGSRSKDYYLLKFDIDHSQYSKEGIYNEFRQPIYVDGV